jgi:hypothetical protein
LHRVMIGTGRCPVRSGDDLSPVGLEFLSDV